MTIQESRSGQSAHLSPETRRTVAALTEAERRLRAFGKIDNNLQYRRGLAVAIQVVNEVRDSERQR